MQIAMTHGSLVLVAIAPTLGCIHQADRLYRNISVQKLIRALKRGQSITNSHKWEREDKILTLKNTHRAQSHVSQQRHSDHGAVETQEHAKGTQRVGKQEAFPSMLEACSPLHTAEMSSNSQLTFCLQLIKNCVSGGND